MAGYLTCGATPGSRSGREDERMGGSEREEGECPIQTLAGKKLPQTCGCTGNPSRTLQRLILNGQGCYIISK